MKQINCSLQVNGILYNLPLDLLNGAVKVYQEGSNDVIMTDFGLRVTYDLVYHVTITVPGNYRGRTCGLCGNFNDNKADEFQLPDGNVTKELQTFGAAWKVPVPGVVCDDGCSGNLCPKCNDSKKAAIEAKCAIIINPEGPFAVCHDIIEPVSYFRDCVYDVCMAKDEQSILCQSIAAYMLDCQNFGAKIQNWRSPSFCRKSAHLFFLLYTMKSNSTAIKHLITFTIKTSLALLISLQLLNAVETAIMKPAPCPVTLHVLVSLTSWLAPQLVLRAVFVIINTGIMELAVCPLTSAAVITKARLWRWGEII